MKRYESYLGDNSDQPHLGTRISSYRCSLPGLTGFTTLHCERTDQSCHKLERAIIAIARQLGKCLLAY